jgi:hypothetical protein
MICKWDIVDLKMGVVYIISNKTPFLTSNAHNPFFATSYGFVVVLYAELLADMIQNHHHHY